MLLVSLGIFRSIQVYKKSTHEYKGGLFSVNLNFRFSTAIRLFVYSQTISC